MGRASGLVDRAGCPRLGLEANNVSFRVGNSEEVPTLC